MRLGYSGSDFPDRAMSYAASTLAETRGNPVSEMLGREACKRVPFLVVAFVEADKLAKSDSPGAVEFARTLEEIARSIPIHSQDPLCYRDGEEKAEFRYLARAILVSTLVSNDDLAEAKNAAKSLKGPMQSGGTFIRAEIRRRLSQILIQDGKYRDAIAFLTEAYTLFEAEGLPDMAALCALRRGIATRLEYGKGRGAEDFSKAAWLATLVRREKRILRDRADRVLCAAIISLIRDFPESRMSDDPEVTRYLVEAKRAIPSCHPDLKALATMVEGLMAARSGSFRLGMKRLFTALSKLIEIRAFDDVAACIGHVVEVQLEWDPDSESARARVDQIHKLLVNIEDKDAERLCEWLSREPADKLVVILRESSFKTGASVRRCPTKAPVRGAG